MATKERSEGKNDQLDRFEVYLKELGKFQVVEIFLAVMAKVQPDKFTVPVKGDVVVHCGLAEDVPHILCATKTTIFIKQIKPFRTSIIFIYIMVHKRHTIILCLAC